MNFKPFRAQTFLDFLKEQHIPDWLLSMAPNILSLIDIEKEYLGMGMPLIDLNNNPWRTTSNPYDNEQLTAAVYIGYGPIRGTFIALDPGSKKRPALSFWQAVAEFHPELCCASFTDILLSYARDVGYNEELLNLFEEIHTDKASTYKQNWSALLKPITSFFEKLKRPYGEKKY